MHQLLNTKDYSTIELILFAGGCYLWVLAYAVYIINIHRKRCIDMAIFAAAGNIGWEFVWSWCPPTTDMGDLLVWAYRIWFIFDLYIFWGILKYGVKQITTPALRPLFKPLCIAAAVLQASLYYAFKIQGFDTTIGATSAYLLQDFISILCVILLLRKPPGVYFSYPVAWLRSVGTATNTIFMFLHYPTNYFLEILAALSLVADGIYIAIFYVRRRENRNWNLENLTAPDPLETTPPLSQAILAAG